MRKIKNKAFSLVELLVVITILAIISVVAYQNFGGAVDKAVSGRKINDISTIETALQQFKVDNNYYPPTDTYSASNLWGYTGGLDAQPSNQIVVTYAGEALDTVTNAEGGGKIYGTGTWLRTNAATKKQIGAKGTISRETLTKKYLSKDLYDPEVGDIDVNDIDNITAGAQAGKLIEVGIGRYIYSTFKKDKGEGATGEWGTGNNFNGNAYNLAFTIKKQGSDKYITKIVGDYDEESCYDDKATCISTLMGSGDSGILLDESEENGESNIDNYGVPYAVTDFAQ